MKRILIIFWIRKCIRNVTSRQLLLQKNLEILYTEIRRFRGFFFEEQVEVFIEESWRKYTLKKTWISASKYAF